MRLKARGAASRNPAVTQTRLSSSKESGSASWNTSDIATGIRSLRFGIEIAVSLGLGLELGRIRIAIRLGLELELRVGKKVIGMAVELENEGWGWG